MSPAILQICRMDQFFQELYAVMNQWSYIEVGIVFPNKLVSKSIASIAKVLFVVQWAFPLWEMHASTNLHAYCLFDFGSIFWAIRFAKFNVSGFKFMLTQWTPLYVGWKIDFFFVTLSQLLWSRRRNIGAQCGALHLWMEINFDWISS